MWLLQKSNPIIIFIITVLTSHSRHSEIRRLSPITFATYLSEKMFTLQGNLHLIPTPRPGCPVMYRIIVYAERNTGWELGSKNVSPFSYLSFTQTYMSTWMKAAKVWKQKFYLGVSWTSFTRSTFSPSPIQQIFILHPLWPIAVTECGGYVLRWPLLLSHTPV